MKYSFKGISWNIKPFHEIYIFDLVSKFHCVYFSSLKKYMFIEKDVFWQRKFNSISFDK